MAKIHFFLTFNETRYLGFLPDARGLDIKRVYMYVLLLLYYVGHNRTDMSIIR